MKPSIPSLIASIGGIIATAGSPALAEEKTIPPVLDYMAMNTTAWDGNLADIRRLSRSLGLKTVAVSGPNDRSGDAYREDLLFLINDAHKNIQPLVDLQLNKERQATLLKRYPYTLSFYPRIPRGIDARELEEMRTGNPTVFEAYRKKFEATKAWANTNKPFPDNLAILQTWGNRLHKGRSARWEPCPDFQQQAVIDELVAEITAYAKAEEIPENNWLFKGLVIDVIEIWREFNWNSGRRLPGSPDRERFAVKHPGITHEYSTLREGWYHFLARLRDSLEAEFPGREIKYVWEPTPFVEPWIEPLFNHPYPSMDAEMVRKIKGDVLMEEKPGLRFLMDTENVLKPERWDIFHVGSSSPDLFTRDPHYPLQLKYFGETTMRGSFLVVYGGWDRDHKYAMGSKAKWNSLLRTLSSWEMLHRTALEDRIYDAAQQIYVSPTAYADLNTTAGLHPENGQIYAVFHNADAQVYLSEGMTVESVRSVNPFWEPSQAADDQIVFENGILRGDPDGIYPLTVIVETGGTPARTFRALPEQNLKQEFLMKNLFEKDIYDPDFELGGTGWVSGGTGKVAMVDDPVFSGRKAAAIYGRGKSWHGLSQMITGYLMQNMQGEYKLTAMVRPKENADDFRIGIRYIEKEKSRREIGRPIRAEPGKWTKIEAIITLDWNDWIERASLDIRRSHPTDTFYVDDVHVIQVRKRRGLGE